MKTKAQKRAMKLMDKAQTNVSRLWNLMCDEDGIPTDSKFVVFSPANRYSAEYNKAVTVFQNLRQAVR